jgi:methyltransferase (TIGR00027 family)
MLLDPRPGSLTGPSYAQGLTYAQGRRVRSLRTAVTVVVAEVAMTMSPGPLPGVGRTALGVAGIRAMESRRADRLFDDPYAQAFVEAGRVLFPELHGSRADSQGREPSGIGALFYPHAVVRTRFYDEFLLSAAAAGCGQVVLLAAGLDTRAFRLSWPKGARVFELDLPEVLRFKQRVLDEQTATPACERTTLPVDLREPWAEDLLAAGFQPSAATVWLAEGLLVYLSYDEASGMLATASELSAPGSQLSFEHAGQDGNGLLARARAMPDAGRLTAMWKGGLGGRAPHWLADHGWQCHIQSRSDLAARYGRPLDEPSSGGFLTAKRT